MLVSVELDADFSVGCAHPAMQPPIPTTYPHPAIRGWFYLSAVCPVVLVAANLYSLPQYLVPSKKPQGGE
jgi:hypothetical protein